MWRRLCVSVLVSGECQKVARLGPMRFILHLPFATHLTNLSMQHASCYQASGRILWVRALICKHKLPPWGCWVWLSAIAFQLSSTRRSASPAREGAADERHHRHSVSFRNGVVTDLSHGICSLTPQSVLPAQSGSWCVSAAWAPSAACLGLRSGFDAL